MRRSLLTAALAAVLLPWWVSAEDRPPAPRPEAAGRDVQDLVFFGSKGPVVIRLHLRVNGQPFRDAFETAWNEYLKTLFRALDRDGDGFLSPAEAARTPAPALVLPGGWAPELADVVHVAFNFAVLDADGDGKVSLEELAAYYRDFGGGPLQTQAAGLRSPASSSDSALFQRLDRNGDGKLSLEELTGAPALLALDLDGDEMLTPAELMGVGRPTAPAPPAAAIAGTALPEDSTFFVNAGEEAASELARRIAKRYRKEIQLGAPDVEIVVRLGRTAPGEPVTEVLRTTSPAVSVRQTPEGVLIRLDDTLIELACNVGKLRTLPADRRYYEDLFQAADTDRQGFLDRVKAQRYPFFATWFDVMDRDGDGRVDEKEFRTFLSENYERLGEALAYRTALLISAEGQGLFDLLDQNRDGRLGLRELREAPKVWQRLNLGPNDSLSPSDIPRSYRIALGLGEASFSRHGGNLVVLPPADPASLAAERLGTGPLWFRKMDRNHDGDVSANEFLGTPEEFRRLDANGDGLISVEEAERAEALRGRQRPQEKPAGR